VLVLVVVGADYAQRGAFAWTPFAGTFVRAARREPAVHQQFPDAGRMRQRANHLVVRLGADTAKWGIRDRARRLRWLVLQIGRYNLRSLRRRRTDARTVVPRRRILRDTRRSPARSRRRSR